MSYNKYRPEEIIIVIPIYKPYLSEYEKITLEQCKKILSQYTVAFIIPKGLDMSNYNFKSLIIKEFPEEFFKGIKGYNKLLLSEFFYKEFSLYKFILIYQLDAFVFHDNLMEWCNKDYDYVGAPWMFKYFLIFINVFLKISPFAAFKLFFTKNFWNPVGNGGLSLRKIESFINHFKNTNCSAGRWNANEDYYWAFKTDFKIPKTKEALRFSIELMPKFGMKLNKNELPFGLHAWKKHNLKFWIPYLGKFGYKI